MVIRCKLLFGAESGIKTASTRLTFRDVLGAWKVRWGIDRMNYKVDPGLYAVGSPSAASPVLVSANYKLTFDSLRKELSRLDCWLLILDTKGVNVWCAAGKGTFGSDELVRRVEATRLPEVVSHRELILPQLSAAGVSAHEISKRTGFSVVYGPVRARDIETFLASGRRATEAMRAVEFTALDRLVLTPVEVAAAAKKFLQFVGVLFLINLFAARPFGFADVAACAGAVAVGTVVVPVLLPVIPGRSFAWKGWLLGLIWTLGAAWRYGWFAAGRELLGAGYVLALPAVSAYLALNFTGSSTYTSFSSASREMRAAVPLIALSAFAGAALVLVKSILG